MMVESRVPRNNPIDILTAERAHLARTVGILTRDLHQAEETRTAAQAEATRLHLLVGDLRTQVDALMRRALEAEQEKAALAAKLQAVTGR